MKIGIIEGSIRDGRKAAAVTDWVYSATEKRDEADYTLIKLSDFNVPLLTSATVPAAANRLYDSAEVTAWGKAIDSCDGFVIVTAEYNHSIPGALKNAIDSIGPEWQDKAAAIVSYGADSGVRAVEHLRTVLANFNMHVVRSQVSLSLFNDFDDKGVVSSERRENEIQALLDSVVKAAKQRQS